MKFKYLPRIKGGAVCNRAIGVNLGIFDSVLSSVDINMPPLQGDRGLFFTRCYKHSVPPGLKRDFSTYKIFGKIRRGFKQHLPFLGTKMVVFY